MLKFLLNFSFILYFLHSIPYQINHIYHLIHLLSYILSLYSILEVNNYLFLNALNQDKLVVSEDYSGFFKGKIYHIYSFIMMDNILAFCKIMFLFMINHYPLLI